MRHPSPFAEDDKQRPGEDVTSTSKVPKFRSKSRKGANQNGRPSRSLKSKRTYRRTKKNPPKKPQPTRPRPRRGREETPHHEYTRKNPELCHLTQYLQVPDEEMIQNPDIPCLKNMKKTAESVEICQKCLF